MTGCFQKGKLITEKNKVNGDKVYTSTDEKHFDKPVTVLINGGSASASEVFAGCMQDRKAASLVGVKSFGKGIVQTIFSLEKSCGGGIKLTTGEYLLPSGRCIQGKGLTPDVEAKNPSDLKQFGGKDDYQLQKAVEVIRKNSRISKRHKNFTFCVSPRVALANQTVLYSTNSHFRKREELSDVI